MNYKGKLLVFIISLVIVVYGISAAFYGKVVAKDEAYKELSVFMEVLKRINDDYVEVPDMNSVQEGAMRGLINALDPYCAFLTKEKYDLLQKRMANGNGGLGMVISKKSDIVYVVSCEKDSPAAVAGVRPGDYLMAVDGRSVEDLSLIEVDSLLHGTPGTKVKLTIFRSSKTKPIDLEITFRDRPAAPVASKMLDADIGLIEVSSLSGNAIDQVRLRLKTLISAGAKKIVLDLRNCASGEPSAGAELANYFLSSGTIFYSQDRQRSKLQVVEADAEKHITDLPMVVLINGSTAGAAEIVAGALKDHRRAKVVGEKSFGIGSAQRAIELRSGVILVLSVAKYCTPSGKVIQDEVARKTGIFPDVQVPDDEMRQDLAVESFYNSDQDEAEKYLQLRQKIEKMQLEKALEILAGDEVPVKKAA